MHALGPDIEVDLFIFVNLFSVAYTRWYSRADTRNRSRIYLESYYCTYTGSRLREKDHSGTVNILSVVTVVRCIWQVL